MFSASRTMDSSRNEWETVTFKKKHNTRTAANRADAQRAGVAHSALKCTRTASRCLSPRHGSN